MQVTVKKGILHVQLVDRPLTRSSDAEDDPNRGRLDDGAERLVVVDAVSLGEAADNPMSPMTSQRDVGVELVLEDPLAGDDVGARRPGDEAPRVVDESLVTGNRRGSGGGSNVSSWWEAVTINRLQRAGLEACHRPARCRRGGGGGGGGEGATTGIEAGCIGTTGAWSIAGGEGCAAVVTGAGAEVPARHRV